MTNDYNWEHFIDLSELFGVSGQEARVVDYLDQIIDLPLERDGIGSALFTKKGEDLRIMIATHMDEVGFYVKEINQEGYIFLQPIGGTWTHVLLNQEVVIVTEENKEFYGVIGSKASHGMSKEERERTVEIEDLYIDMGVEDKKELIALGIQAGDMVVPVAKTRIMNNKDYITGKAFDNRASVAVGSWLMNSLTKNPTRNEVVLAATVQEEVGLRGARTTADLVYPDLAIAVDTTLAGDTPADKNNIKLGKGVSISVIDSMTVLNRGILVYLEQLCERKGINYQLGCFTGGGTDAGNIHKSRGGIPTINISIPMRYMHTPRGVIHRKDVIETYKLLDAIVHDLTTEKYQKILEENYNYREVGEAH